MKALRGEEVQNKNNFNESAVPEGLQPGLLQCNVQYVLACDFLNNFQGGGRRELQEGGGRNQDN